MDPFGRHGEIDLLPELRCSTSPSSGLPKAIREAIANKPENHTFTEDFQATRPMAASGD